MSIAFTAIGPLEEKALEQPGCPNSWFWDPDQSYPAPWFLWIRGSKESG